MNNILAGSGTFDAEVAQSVIFHSPALRGSAGPTVPFSTEQRHGEHRAALVVFLCPYLLTRSLDGSSFKGPSSHAQHYPLNTLPLCGARMRHALGQLGPGRG